MYIITQSKFFSPFWLAPIPWLILYNQRVLTTKLFASSIPLIQWYKLWYTSFNLIPGAADPKHIAWWMLSSFLSTFCGVSERVNIRLSPCKEIGQSFKEILQEGKLVKNLEILWMNNKRIIALGYHMMWKIIQILEDAIHWGWNLQRSA